MIIYSLFRQNKIGVGNNLQGTEDLNECLGFSES